jgi:hypothetical protein
MTARSASTVQEINMKPENSVAPFPFVLDELHEIHPAVRRMFGMTYLYCEETLLLALRDSARKPDTNGVWVYTQVEHLNRLRREFPLLPGHYFWKSGKKGWVILASKLEYFEEYVLHACELILRGDHRIGRISRGAMVE